MRSPLSDTGESTQENTVMSDVQTDALLGASHWGCTGGVSVRSKAHAEAVFRGETVLQFSLWCEMWD